ncbi:YcxB family protein [Streptococcus sanguinis]|uniref:YcxB family protein n=1 Tax=Streptococcus sanguinis TaxID=1305 RepID=UPI002284B559|nr:YcxB family protein [Streptococcus sanguinis]MCY7029214.1 YcxB family protein [Streptococcus sanguinis]
MFPIRITTLLTEEVYKRFSWAILIRRKGFVLYIIILIIGLFTYVMLGPLEEKIISIILAPPICASMYYFGMNYQIKRAYQKTPFWKDMEQTLIFEKDKFSVKSKRGEFLYSYDDIVKVFHTKEDFYIMLGPNVGFPIEKKNCSPEALEFLLELHIEHM